jgi:hypothetical protein
MAKMPNPTPSDPRKGVGSPVQYHTEGGTATDQLSGQRKTTTQPLPPPESDPPPVTDSALWRKLKAKLLFWRAARDVVQVSVFGPTAVAPGQASQLTVYLHTPDVVDNVRTLSRAFHHDSELLGTGFVGREVAREAQLAVHLSMANAGISRSLQTVFWHGQPQRLVFDLHIPWEAASGPAPGVVSVGANDVRIGKTEFRLLLLPRKG